MLIEKTVRGFIDDTASNSPAPGGGSIAALSASSSAALIAMVANLTVGKEKFADVEEEMQEVIRKATAFKDMFLEYIDKDANSFNAAMAAFKLPKETEEEKAHRAKMIQEGYKGAANVPFTVGKEAFKLMELAEFVVEKGNQNAVTDGAVAAMQARTAVHSAFYNVKINLGSIKDEEYVAKMRSEMKELEDKVDEIETRIRSKVHL